MEEEAETREGTVANFTCAKAFLIHFGTFSLLSGEKRGYIRAWPEGNCEIAMYRWIILKFHVASKCRRGESLIRRELPFIPRSARSTSCTRNTLERTRGTIYHTRFHRARTCTGTHMHANIHRETRVHAYTANLWKEIIIELFLWIKNKLSVIYNN